jgi:hypothetical protein
VLLQVLVSEQAGCPSGTIFPKIIGGKIGDTEFKQLDYHSTGPKIVIGGFTSDTGLKGINS